MIENDPQRDQVGSNASLERADAQRPHEALDSAKAILLLNASKALASTTDGYTTTRMHPSRFSCHSSIVSIML
jgi:hypothetical protein